MVRRAAVSIRRLAPVSVRRAGPPAAGAFQPVSSSYLSRAYPWRLFRRPDYSEVASDIRQKGWDSSGIDHGS